MNADGSRTAHLIWTLSGLLLVAWGGWFLFSSVTVYVTSEKLRLESKQAPHQIEAQISGQILSTSLAIGKHVKAGDLVVEIDATAERHRLDEEKAHYAATIERIAAMSREITARKKLAKDSGSTAGSDADMVRARIAANASEIALAVDHQSRTAKLVASGVMAKVATLKAESDLQRLREERKKLKAELRRVASELDRKDHELEADIESLNFQLAQLEGDLASSKVTMERLAADIEKRLVRSPVSGQLGDVLPYHVGSFLPQGTTLATIVPPGDVIAVAEFPPSASLGRIKPGQRARITLDAFPWAQFGSVAAVVKTVAHETRDGVLRAEFAIDAKQSPGIGLQHGLPGTVEVEIENVSPAVLVLRAAGVTLSGESDQRIAALQP